MVAPQAQTRATGAAAGDGVRRAELEQALNGRTVQEERRRPRFAIRRPREHEDLREPLAVLALELARSRRYEHPLTLIGIVPHCAAADAAAEIRRYARTVDSVWASSTEVFILMPESDGDDGNALLARLRRVAATGVEGAATHVAVFPADALTAGALLEIADGRMAPPLVEPPLRGARRRPAAAGPPEPAERPVL